MLLGRLYSPIIAFSRKSCILSVMVVRMRSTRSHRNNRRSHFALSSPALSTCTKCKSPVRSHRACAKCGTYKGRSVIDVQARIDKKAKKQKEKAKTAVK